MFTTFTVVGLFFVWAGIQQYFLNRLIKADNEYLKQLCAQAQANRAATAHRPKSSPPGKNSLDPS